MFTFEVKREIDFDDVYEECNSTQERDVLDTICKNGKEEELMWLLAESFSATPTMDEISDMIYHEWEYIFKQLNIDEEDEEDEEE